MLKQVTQNIEDTIAVPHEIIAFDNSNGQKGICEIYNLGAKQARYDILCFMHEDVAMQTSNWGTTVATSFEKDSKLGLLGIAGCSYKSKSPSGWVCYGSEKILHYNLIQSFKYGQQETKKIYSNPHNEPLSRVACVDGVWFCSKKELFEKIQFDEHLLKGFHGYDVDFSLAVNQYYNVAVTYDILLHHFSEGKFEKDWLEEVLKVSDKWKNKLPLSLASLNRKEKIKIEQKTFENLIGKMIHHGITFSFCWKMIAGETYPDSGVFIKLKLFAYLLKNRGRFSKR